MGDIYNEWSVVSDMSELTFFECTQFYIHNESTHVDSTRVICECTQKSKPVEKLLICTH